ncbi:precorrin-2 dehydrogenase/sirohydrochlorin ferrochelatase family protein [Veillonella magna]|uniref:precorrin-2 dehydrogenase/sirohydrochlorin ferrochelatase family protein n=1 Tax=Veillonella magna TaxID=464322 RepID=UPI0023F213C6|nr:bifunctional precorrin-2 dehydrogenase/sirohydrochlorin ferrochelatase [Veillonella magna]
MVMLEVTMKNRPCLVVGGGAVAERRIGLLLADDADIIVISPVVTDTIEKWAENGEINLVREGYEKGQLTQADFVVVATDSPMLNKQCAEEAREMGALVNRADDNDDCDFVFPMTVREGALTVAVAGDKASPRLLKLVGQDIRQRYRLVAAIMPALKEIRNEVKLLLPTSKERQVFWRKHFGEAELTQIIEGKWKLVEEKVRYAVSRIGIKP